ncbi:DUF2256 domain-containing protein [Marivirga arenosa]
MFDKNFNKWKVNNISFYELELKKDQLMTKMTKKRDLPSKTCPVCNRPFVWRKKWEKNWESVKYCSKKCSKEAKFLKKN